MLNIQMHIGDEGLRGRSSTSQHLVASEVEDKQKADSVQ